METYPILSKIKYEDPKYNVEKPERVLDKKKTLVVINTYIPKDGTVEYNTRSYFDHEYRRYEHNRIEALKFTLACYKHFDAEADYDLIIVDNSSPYFLEGDYGAGYLENDGNDFNGIPLYFRENTYYSFGSYKYAWDNFKDKYDYFLFHEFDWTPTKDGWLKDLINYWNSDKEIGMIGNLIEEFGYGQQDVINHIIRKVAPGRDKIHNLDSEYLFTDKVVLNQMEENGGWNIFRCEPEVEETPVINELGMQQPILEMGYKLACYNDEKHTMFYAIYNSGFPLSGKWWKGLDKLSPLIPEQARLFVPEVSNYFSWYKGKSSFVKWI